MCSDLLFLYDNITQVKLYVKKRVYLKKCTIAPYKLDVINIYKSTHKNITKLF